MKVEQAFGKRHSAGSCFARAIHGQAKAALLGVVLCLLACPFAAAQTNAKNVLVLFSLSDRHGFSALDDLKTGMQSAISLPMNFYVENLEGRRFDDKDYEKDLVANLRNSYRGVKLDLVITEKDPALEFAVTHRNELFPGVPIVFYDLETTNNQQKTWPGVTGVTAPVDVRATIDLALRLEPNTNTVAVVIGNSPYERYWLAQIQSELHRYQGREKEIDLVSLPPEQVLERVDSLPPQAVVLFELARQESLEPAFSTYDLLSLIGQHRPTFCVFAWYCLNRGGIGGDSYDGFRQIALVSGLAKRVLAGESPDRIPVAHDAQRQIFVDWRQLQRWNIRETALMPGTVVLNRQPGVWDLYRWYIIGGILLILAETLLILGLLWQRARRRKVEGKLHASEKELAGVVASAMDAIIAIDEQQHIALFNAAAEKMFGCAANEAIGGRIDRFIPQRFRSKHAEHIQRFARSGVTNRTMGALGALWGVRANGEEFPIEASISQVEADGAKLFTVIIRDITARKNAEEALVHLSGQLIQAQEEERRRIAREIHDDFQQRLAMLAIDLDNLAENIDNDGSQASRRLRELWNSVSELGSDLHSLSHRLHSSTLESLGLAAALRALCEEFENYHGIDVSFAEENVPRRIPSEAALCLFRVAQEALQNVRKHSGAKKAEVRLEGLGDNVHLSISDHGSGFNSGNGARQEGIGIRSMEERLRLVKGSFAIHSRPMGGTRIDAWVPVHVAEFSNV